MADGIAPLVAVTEGSVLLGAKMVVFKVGFEETVLVAGANVLFARKSAHDALCTAHADKALEGIGKSVASTDWH